MREIYRSATYIRICCTGYFMNKMSANFPRLRYNVAYCIQHSVAKRLTHLMYIRVSSRMTCNVTETSFFKNSFFH
jgi:hypothetical protein